MVTLRAIDATLFPRLHESFLKQDDPLSTEQDWRNLFDYQWDNPLGHCGYALLDGTAVVGMLGMVASERQIDGVSRKFCNLHTWWVREDHRGRSLSLLRPIMKLQDYTLTHLTADDAVRAVTKRLGFQDLSSQLTILLPDPRRSEQSVVEGSIEADPDRIAVRLEPRDVRILQDHRPAGIGHLLAGNAERACYVVYTHVVRHRLPYCHIHYMSDKTMFLAAEPAIRRWLLTRHSAHFVAIDTRLVSDLTLRRSFRFWAPAHALYRSTDVRPDQIDNLYSDVTLLKLTVLPDMSHELRQLARRVLGRG